MKKAKILAGILLTAMLFAGCLTTLHPIFTEKDLVADSRLIGHWEKGKDKSEHIYRSPTTEELNNLSATLQRNADKIYMLDEEDEQGNLKTTYYAFLVKLGKYYYLDYYPAEELERKSADDFFATHYIPMHSIYRMKFTGNNSLYTQQLDGGYLERLIKNKQIRIRHEVMDDGSFVITAPTEELQQYLIKYSDVPEAYNNDNSNTYTRMN